MWDTAIENTIHLSRELPCLSCGHAEHVYLPCDAECGCERSPIPGRYSDADLVTA